MAKPANIFKLTGQSDSFPSRDYRRPREEIAFTAWPKIQSIFCLPHQLDCLNTRWRWSISLVHIYVPSSFFIFFFSNLLDSKLGNNSRISQTNSRLYDLKKCWKKYGFHVLNQISNSADEFVRHHCTEMMKFTVYACNKAWNFTSVLCILLGKKAKFKA